MYRNVWYAVQGGWNVWVCEESLNEFCPCKIVFWVRNIFGNLRNASQAPVVPRMGKFIHEWMILIQVLYRMRAYTFGFSRFWPLSWWISKLHCVEKDFHWSILSPLGKTIFCCIIYRQHNSPEYFQSYLEDAIERLALENKVLYVIDDLNIDLLRHLNLVQKIGLAN